jgi:mannose-1-phosphate guanylyltransferase/mannose-6-phosphate isomerase
LVTEHSLFQDTLLRVRHLGDRAGEPIVVCNSAHRFLVAEQLREIELRSAAIVLEPGARNTAPAVAAAALLVQGASAAADPLLLVLPSDHVILDVPRFLAAVETAIEPARNGRLTTFGIVPDRPETGYGYLKRGDSAGDWSLLERFVEKPNLATAQEYVESGQYLWNSGMFLFSAAAFLSDLGIHAPAMLAQCRAAVANASVDSDFTRLGPEFLECPSESIDCAVMEKTAGAAVVPLAAGWSDVGSWAALHEVLDKDSRGNVLRGDVIADACTNTLVNAESRLVAVVGANDVVIIETSDAVLVTSRDATQHVKRVVDALRAAGRSDKE